MQDQDLVKNVLSGDQRSSRVFIDQYQRLVMHSVARLVDNDLDREDLCQEVFIKIFNNLRKFKFEAKLSTWIATIAYRMAIDFLKKNNKRKVEQDLDNIKFEIAVHDTEIEDLDYAKFISGLIMQMPDNYRSILTLFHLDGFSYPEIVEITGMPEGTVKNYLFRARNKLKELSKPYLGKEINFH